LFAQILNIEKFKDIKIEAAYLNNEYLITLFKIGMIIGGY
tara:strand:- start:147 stop:266 length:120 start_codon:yes stop_codon:yes gene_type:complete